MVAITKSFLLERPVFALSSLTIICGTAGMAISFLFLSSSHHLDVLAGSAGFIAGSVLAAGGLISISLQRSIPKYDKPQSPSSRKVIELDPPLNVERWLNHFQRNQENRFEPEWNAPITLAADVVRPLLRSLEQFQLGDGGGPAYLIAYDRERFLSQSEGTRELVDLWFAEEREHARLLKAAVIRFGGKCIDHHWSFTAFCLSRKWFGVRFELTVLLLTEIVSTVYYRMLRRHSNDPALRSMSQLIIRDETGHVSFHRDRLVRTARTSNARYGKLWEARFRLLGLGAASMLWINHAPGLCAIGATTNEFYREVWQELTRFVVRLRFESEQNLQ
ncbi:MAG TPA: ferritin-like domain-containing protein [Gemmata sp.]|nr:ferritin-like domain-containing protein [Gemmata sp.]